MELERIWEAHCTGRRRGSYEELRPDLVYGHEGTLALILPELERLGGPRLKPECLFFVVDHFAPPSTGPFADIVQDFKGFCRTRSIGLALYEGIGHRLMLESPRVTRGMLVLGADSHTTTIGGKGALGIGLGSTDILAVLMTGTAWLQRPAVSEVGVDGTLPPFVDTRDATLHLLGRVGQAGFLGQVVEFVDSTPDGLSLEAASVLTNMTVEMGAVSGLLAQRMAGDESGSRPGTSLSLTGLRPVVALPGAPDRIVDAATLGDVRIDAAHIGSCTCGGLSDLESAARVLAGRHVADGVSLFVTPATRSVLQAAIRNGTAAALVEAGAVLLNPSCGFCGGIDKGIPAEGEVTLSTGPRNYGSRARIGSQVYLASAATAAASAVAGRIVSPVEVLP